VGILQGFTSVPSVSSSDRQGTGGEIIPSETSDPPAFDGSGIASDAMEGPGKKPKKYFINI